MLVVLVVAADCGERPKAAAQPASLAANKPAQASPMVMPSNVVLVEMTPIGLVVGNYPFVTARVSEQAAVFEVPREQAPIRFETVDSEDGLVALAGSWDALVRAMPRPSPFLLHCWLVEWWRHYGEGNRLAVEVAFRGDQLVGALPLITFSRRGLRVGTFGGSRQSALADALVAEGEGQEVVEALVDRVLASQHDYVDLFGLSDQGRLAGLEGPRGLELFQRIEAPVLDLSDGWDAAYRAKTNSRKRAHHNRRRRQLAELGKLEVIHARTVHVKVRLTGAATENPASPLALPGYVHLYLDSKIISIAPVASHNSVTKQTIGHVKPGRHTLKTEFVGPTHLPFRPRVIASVTFTVRR